MDEINPIASEPVAPSTNPSSSALPDMGQLFKESWLLLKERFLVLLGVTIIPVFLYILGSVVFVGGAISLVALRSKLPVLGSGGAMGTVIIAILVGLLILAAILYITGGVQASLIKAVSNPVKIGVIESYKQGFKRAWPMAWAIFLLGLIIMFGFVLLIIPGIIFAVWYMFTYIVLVNEGLSAGESLKRSKALVKERFWPVFLRMATVIGTLLAISWLLGLAQGDKPGILTIVSLIVSFGFGFYIQCYVFKLYEHLKMTR